MHMAHGTMWPPSGWNPCLSEEMIYAITSACEASWCVSVIEEAFLIEVLVHSRQRCLQANKAWVVSKSQHAGCCRPPTTRSLWKAWLCVVLGANCVWDNGMVFVCVRAHQTVTVYSSGLAARPLFFVSSHSASADSGTRRLQVQLALMNLACVWV